MQSYKDVDEESHLDNNEICTKSGRSEATVAEAEMEESIDKLETDINTKDESKSIKNLRRTVYQSRKKKSQLFEKTEEKMNQEFIKKEELKEKYLEEEEADRMNMKLVRNFSLKKEPSIYDLEENNNNDNNHQIANDEKKNNNIENEKTDEQKMQDLARAGEMKNEIETLKYRLSFINEELIDSRSDNSTFHRKIANLQKNITGFENTNKRLETQIKNLIDKINVREKLILKNNLVGIYMADPDYEPPETIGNGILISKESMEFINEAGIANQHTYFYETIEFIINKFKDLQKENPNLRSEIKELNTYIDKVNMKEKSLVEQFNKEISDLNEQLVKMESNFNKSRRLANTLATENDHLKNENERMIIRIKGVDEINAKNAELIKNYKKEIYDMKRKLKQQTQLD